LALAIEAGNFFVWSYSINVNRVDHYAQ